MTDKDQEVSSLYPPPPPYISFFSDENVKKVKELRAQGNTDDEISEMKDLRFLVPPKQPETPSYRSFGDVWPFEDRFITLKESGVTQLYGEDKENEDEEVFTQERIEELKKLTKSLLLNFLELVGIMAKNPADAFPKIDNIRIILINLHHLLNTYRLHQSRESLILMKQEKIRKDRDTIANIEKVCENVQQKIKMLVLSGDSQQKADEAEKNEHKDDTGSPEKLVSDKEAIEKARDGAADAIVEEIKAESKS